MVRRYICKGSFQGDVVDSPGFDALPACQAWLGGIKTLLSRSEVYVTFAYRQSKVAKLPRLNRLFVSNTN